MSKRGDTVSVVAETRLDADKARQKNKLEKTLAQAWSRYDEQG